MTTVLPRPAETPTVTTERICADAVCECGLFLTYVAGTYRHLPVCPQCYDPRTERSLLDAADVCAEGCHAPSCPGVEPVLCEHGGCHAEASLIAYPCAEDRERCCGCCHGD